MDRTERFENPDQDRFVQQDKKVLPANMWRPPWVYIHNAQQWECVCTGSNPDDDRLDPAKYEWIPLLGRIEGSPGDGGVTLNPQSRRINFSGALAGHATLGQYGIQPEDSRLGKYRNYNANFYPCENVGKRYCEPGERLTKLSNGTVLTSRDDKVWFGFLRHLETAGLVEPMAVDVYNVMVAKVRSRIKSLKKLKSREALREEAEFALKCMESAWKRRSAAATIEPVEMELDVEPATEGTAPVSRAAGTVNGVPQARKRAPRAPKTPKTQQTEAPKAPAKTEAPKADAVTK